jgi:hypothetical protein
MSDERSPGLLPAPLPPQQQRQQQQVERAERQEQEAAMKKPPDRPKNKLVLIDQAAKFAHAEQIRAAQQRTGEQVGHVVRQSRSCTKAAHTQAAP